MDEQYADQRILIEIVKAMQRTAYLPLQQIDLRFEAGTVLMRGLVPTYFLKQLAQVTALSVRGVEHIDNQLRVTDGEQLRVENSVEETAAICVRSTSWPRSRPALTYA